MNDMNVGRAAYLMALWQRVVPKRYRLQSVTDTHAVFVHPTKGYRRIAKKRLGL